MKLFLGHGASGTAASMRPWVDALGRRDVETVALDLPRGNQQAKAIDTFRTALAAEPGAAIGGHSYGGRMASMLAAEQPAKALVLLSYPLHPPGRPEQLRTDHWSRITCPVLMLSGDRDPFASIGLLRAAISQLPRVDMVIYPGGRHGLKPQLESACDRVAEFLRATQ